MRTQVITEFEVEFKLRPDRANYGHWKRQVASGCQGCVLEGWGRWRSFSASCGNNFRTV